MKEQCERSLNPSQWVLTIPNRDSEKSKCDRVEHACSLSRMITGSLFVNPSRWELANAIAANCAGRSEVPLTWWRTPDCLPSSDRRTQTKRRRRLAEKLPVQTGTEPRLRFWFRHFQAQTSVAHTKLHSETSLYRLYQLYRVLNFRVSLLRNRLVIKLDFFFVIALSLEKRMTKERDNRDL